MNWRFGLFSFAMLLMIRAASAQYAVEVVSYNAGATPSPGGFVNPAAALGPPERITGDGTLFEAAVTPFNPPFQTDELVSIGEGGELVLRLSHFVVPQPGAPEIGVFANVGLFDIDFPNGQAGTMAGGNFGTFGIDAAEVAVSDNGTNWVSLGTIVFDLPTAGFIDTAATTSDFSQPFTGALRDFEGLNLAGMYSLLGGSGGGTWLDISGTGLAQVGYLRFRVLDDLDSSTSLNFDLDAVSISSAALGATTVPEPATIGVLALAAGWLVHRMRRRRSTAGETPSE